jgi:hypothetical protein
VDKNRGVVMLKPSPYSNTDAAEVQAVELFKRSLDPHLVKHDIRTRDKQPNVDGTVELVDQQNFPFGKFDVQVKKIGDGQKSYSCPSSLVAYSEKTTLPLLLICADVSLSRVYWRHITPSMPEFKEGQDSFTIHFDEASDCITPDGVYLQKWTDISHDYRERISKYPQLKSEHIYRLTFGNVPRPDIILFQEYIDTINTLLDGDFITIKKIVFPDVWKLGVGIYGTDEDSVSFQLYKIPYGESAPVVSKLDGEIFEPTMVGPYSISSAITSREAFYDPIASGKSLVLDQVKRAVEERLLPVHGQLTSKDVIFTFVDEYYDLLNLHPTKDQLNIEEVSQALNGYFLGICASVVSRMSLSSSSFVVLRLENVAQYVRSNKVEPIAPSKVPVKFAVRSDHLTLRVIFDALRNLISTNSKVIDRPFIPKRRPVRRGNWISSTYSPDDEIRNITVLLENAISEYSNFVSHNRLKFPASKYLDQNTTIIWEYGTSFGHDRFGHPLLRELQIDNQAQQLPKLIVSIAQDASLIDDTKFPQVTFKGEKYQATTSSTRSAQYLLGRLPLLSLMYEMLEEDLSKHYGISSFTPFRSAPLLGPVAGWQDIVLF